MPKTIARMTRDELREMIADAVETAVELKLQEMLGDPDAGLTMRRALKQRLLRQKRAVASGERGRPLREVVAELGLE
jgi:hypothetical protein